MFLQELFDLRNRILTEREQHKNKHDIQEFMTYLKELLLSNRKKIEEAFRNYVINNPTRNTYTVEREYSIPAVYANGLRIFFGLFGNNYSNDFIDDIIKTEYYGYHITIKNITEKEDYKIFVRYFIDLTEINKYLFNIQ